MCCGVALEMVWGKNLPPSIFLLASMALRGAQRAFRALSGSPTFRGSRTLPSNLAVSLSRWMTQNNVGFLNLTKMCRALGQAERHWESKMSCLLAGSGHNLPSLSDSTAPNPYRIHPSDVVPPIEMANRR